MKRSPKIQIRAAWLIDGTGSGIIRDPLIHIKDNKIDAVIQEGFCPDTCEPGDYPGCTIVPALIDCHVHLAVTGSPEESDRAGQLDMPGEVIEKRIESHIRNHFDHGILAVRDAGDRGAFALKYRLELSEKNVPVHIEAAGSAWHGRGLYGAFLGRSPEEGEDPAEYIFKNHEKGIDLIKIINSGIISLKDRKKEILPHFSEDEIRRITKGAKRSGLSVMVHANGPIPVSCAIAAQCSSIEHGFFMGDDNLKKMAEKSVVWIPTVYTMEALRSFYKPGNIEYEIASWALEDQIIQIEKAFSYGVPVALGSDSGSMGVNHGYSMIDEIKMFLKAGISIEKVFQAIADTGSRLFKKGESPLPIKKGLPATFLVVEGGPSDLPCSLNSIRAICSKGDIWNMTNGTWQRSVSF